MNQRLPRAIVRNPRIPLGAGRMADDLFASLALVSSACVGLAGCVSIYEQEHASIAGWRVAEVLAIGDSEGSFVRHHPTAETKDQSTPELLLTRCCGTGRVVDSIAQTPNPSRRMRWALNQANLSM